MVHRCATLRPSCLGPDPSTLSPLREVRAPGGAGDGARIAGNGGLVPSPLEVPQQHHEPGDRPLPSGPRDDGAPDRHPGRRDPGRARGALRRAGVGAADRDLDVDDDPTASPPAAYPGGSPVAPHGNDLGNYQDWLQVLLATSGPMSPGEAHSLAAPGPLRVRRAPVLTPPRRPDGLGCSHGRETEHPCSARAEPRLAGSAWPRSRGLFREDRGLADCWPAGQASYLSARRSRRPRRAHGRETPPSWRVCTRGGHCA